jgi:hypothetical protein
MDRFHQPMRRFEMRMALDPCLTSRPKNVAASIDRTPTCTSTLFPAGILTGKSRGLAKAGYPIACRKRLRLSLPLALAASSTPPALVTTRDYGHTAETGITKIAITGAIAFRGVRLLRAGWRSCKSSAQNHRAEKPKAHLSLRRPEGPHYNIKKCPAK